MKRLPFSFMGVFLSLGFALAGIILPIRPCIRKWVALAKHLLKGPVKDF